MLKPLVLLPAIFAIAMAQPGFAQETRMPPTMSMQGLGQVYAAPDTAMINSGVTTEGKTAREALGANTAAMTQLIDTLKAAGIEARDIQTSNFNVSPQYVYSDQRDANGYQLPPRITGYQVSNAVSVKVRALDKLGAILDQIVSVGANTINGVSFSVDDTSSLMDEARKLAFADAKAKADLYAAAAEVELGAILSLSEQPAFSPPQPYMMKDAMRVQAASAVPMETGEVGYTVTVLVQWQLEQ